MNDHDLSEHDHELDELWSVLSSATNRDLARRRTRIRRRGLVMSLAAVFVLATSVAIAMPNGPIRNLFAPDVSGPEQVKGLNQLGRPLGPGDEDLRRVYADLAINGEHQRRQIPDADDARVLIDRGDEFKMIGVVTKGPTPGICYAWTMKPPKPQTRNGRTSNIPYFQRGCFARIIYEQPFTASSTKPSDSNVWTYYGFVADGVRDITFRTNLRTVKVRVENKAYYWRSKPNERMINMTARRPDGTLYQSNPASGRKK